MTTEPVQTWASPEAAEMWRRSAARRAQTLARATQEMLAAAGLVPGQKVLDVAAGTGEQTVLAAQRVLPGGSVLATDISASMLDVTADVTREAGLENVTTLTADASVLDLAAAEFDAAICRFGLMFVPDLQAALSRIRQALKPGSRFAALVWASETDNPFIGLQLGVVRQLGRMPSPLPTLARTVSLSAPGFLATQLERAGFHDVTVRPIETPRVFSSVDDALEAMQSSTPASGELGRDMTAADRQHYLDELRRRLEAYVRPDGQVILPGAALLSSAVA
ncbi:MAG TPA: methyltransferase domain-containing protein [Chloroflexota bacterium]